MSAFSQPRLCTRCTSSVTRVAGVAFLVIDPSRRRHAYTAKARVHDGRPFRMAVIGSGPAGFYTTYKVMSQIENSAVDMYEQLPVPFGLVRFGVAPDHPEVKNCQEKFEDVANSPRFSFVGNVSIGEGAASLPLQSLLPHYDAILFAYGASRDRTLGIPGEDQLEGIYSARAFVGWYNGLPEYSKVAPDLTQSDEAVVIGQGNVALDVARILLQDPNILKSTDITENALETLKKSKVNRVRIIGRRGPVQAAFTIKEVRELTKLPSVVFHPIDERVMPNENIIKSLPRASRRIMELLKSTTASLMPMKNSSPRSVCFDFGLSPTAFNPDFQVPTQLRSISFEETSLIPNAFEPTAKAVGTGKKVDIRTSLAFRSIGYKSKTLSGFDEVGIPFDDRLGIIPNDQHGRVKHENSATPVPGMYCSGWVKRGPTGVIASTMHDAFSTAESISKDWYAHVAFLNTENGHSTSLGWEAVRDKAKAQGCRSVSWEDWKKIDMAEREMGQKRGKQREKFTNVEDMLAVID